MTPANARASLRHSVKTLFAATAVLVAITSAPLKAEIFASPNAALQQGISAYRGGYYDIAIPSLKYAADNDLFLAQFYLAELYADNNSAHTDHVKAYRLFRTMANNHADIDPADSRRAPFVAQALTSLARYMTRGLPTIGLQPDAKTAAEYLHHAAIFFNHEDAQFELAKLHLRGEGVESDVKRGRHWLARLSKKGHAGAQAFLADLHWRGMYVRKNPERALALISVAVKNAPDKDRVWIEDVYQQIYCGASHGVRKTVDGGVVARWDRRYGRKPSLDKRRRGVGGLRINTRRVCQDGQTPPLLINQPSTIDSGGLLHKAPAESKPPGLRQSHPVSANADETTPAPNGTDARSLSASRANRGDNVVRGGAMGLIGSPTLRHIDETERHAPRN